MKRNGIKLLVCIMAMVAVLCACGKQDTVDFGLLKPFIGAWQCSSSPLEHEEYYTGFLVMKVEEDGSFRMYDAEAGNPGISGRLDIISDSELILICDTEDDFDPPPTWEDMTEEQTITYEFVSESELHLVFENNGSMSTLVFHVE